MCICVTGQVPSVAALETPEMRNQWERAFNATYIQPVLEDLSKRFGNTMRAIVEESKQGLYAVPVYNSV